MALKNINLPCGVNDQMDDQKLECPFTWAMEKITKELIDDEERWNYDKEQSLPEKEQNDEKEQDLPLRDDMDHLFRLMKHVMTVYVNVKAKVDSEEIFNDLKKCDEDLTGLKEYNHPEVSIDVVHFILRSTQSFIFKELNFTKELSQTLSQIKEWKWNSKEKSTLNTCRSICWWECNHIPVFESEHFIREAIKHNPKCELWYFVLGKNLRRKRREANFQLYPTKEEIDSFLKAYNMSAKPAYGIFVAQMYREIKRYKDAEKIFNEIFEQNPNLSPTILLRLALGFIHLKSFTKAKVCLDKVEAMQPYRSMFLHYRGIYHLRLNEYEKAEKFLKEAGSKKNFAAERQYLECALKLNSAFEIMPYLHNMVDKYKTLTKEQLQQLLLDLALTYWKRKDDVPNALIYFLKAVEISPENSCITKYYVCKYITTVEKNIYRLLNREILPFVRINKEKFEQSCIDRAEDLQKYCDQYFSKNLTKH